MGIMGRLGRINKCSKKQCRSLFLRMRAAMRKAVKKQTINLYGGTKKEFDFKYDPSSYALNFDDGNSFHHQHHVVEHHRIIKVALPKKEGPHALNTTVYVMWVGSF